MSQSQQLERTMVIDHSIRDEEYPNAERMAERLEVSRRDIIKAGSAMILQKALGHGVQYRSSKGFMRFAYQAATLAVGLGWHLHAKTAKPNLPTVRQKIHSEPQSRPRSCPEPCASRRSARSR
jgi:hypothetical protein